MTFKLVHYSPLEKEIVGLFETNLTMAEIAEKLGIGKTTLRNSVKKLGLKRSPRFKYRGYDKRKIVELETLGLTNSDIAKKLGIHVSTLRRIKKKLGLLKRTDEMSHLAEKIALSKKYNKLHGISPICSNQTNILEKYADEITELLNKGISKAEIARRYNVCPATVFNFIYLYGLKAPVIKKCDDVMQLEQVFKDGVSLKRIAKNFNCSEKLVANKIKELQWKRLRTSVKKSSPLNNQEELIKELYYQGLSGYEIAKKVQAHPISVYNKIKKMKLCRTQKRVEYNSTLKGKKELLLNMKQSGKRINEIAKYFNVCPTTVRYHLKKWEEGHV